MLGGTGDAKRIVSCVVVGWVGVGVGRGRGVSPYQ